MSIDRRNFLKKGLAATGAAAAAGVTAGCGLGPGSSAPEGAEGAVALTVDGRLVQISNGGMQLRPAGLPPSDPRVWEGVPGRKWVMVIDLAACDGCGACTRSCNTMHHLPPDREFIKVLRMQDSPTTAPYWFPKPCFQCDNTPCTKVCPTGASFKRRDGIVLVDADTCIGCRFCMAACPYGTRVFNWAHPDALPAAMGHEYSPETGFPRKVGTVSKCDFCPEYLRDGRLPPCAADCAMGAIYFGDQNEDAVVNSLGHHVRLSDLLRDRAAYRHLEKLGTEPSVYYLPPRDRRYPVLDRTEAVTEADQTHAAAVPGQDSPDIKKSCPL